MALPQRQSEAEPDITPGQTRRQRTADFAYLNEAANDDRYTSIDEQYAGNAYRDNLLQPVGIGRKAVANEDTLNQFEQPEFNEEEVSPTPDPRPSRAMQNMLKARTAKKLASTLSTTGGRARASAINAEAFSWQVPLWLCVQLPFAVLSLVTLATVGVMDAVTTNSEGGFINWVIDKVLAAASAIAKIVGIDFLAIAVNVYMLSTMIILGLGIFSIGFLFLQYKISFLEPLGGEKSGLKHGLLLLTIIGYCVPVANLFPFIFLWMAAVWYYPR